MNEASIDKNLPVNLLPYTLIICTLPLARQIPPH